MFINCSKLSKTNQFALDLRSVNMSFPYRYPKTHNVFSRFSLEQVKTLIAENPTFFVTEKLDGCSLAISSKKYVASRDLILPSKKDLKDQAFQGVGLRNVQPMFQKIDHLKELLNSYCLLDISENDEILIYSEFILPGTSTCKHDIYNYRQNKIQLGKCYAYAVGFVFDNSNDSANKAMLKRYFPNVVQLENEEGKVYFLSLINQTNRRFFTDCNIDLVPMYPPEKFVNILTKSKYMLLEKLKSRLLEGFVIHSDTGEFFKWKYPVKPERMRNECLMREMEESFTSEDEKKVFSAYKSLCEDSNRFVNTFDRKRFFKLFDIQMYRRDTLYADLEKSNDANFTIHCWKNELFHKICQELKPNEDLTFDKRVLMKIDDLVLQKLNHLISHCL